ncbi:Uncharacterised protein [[Clostridium] sordellii]|uniref:hypothetical protein n=1 Tax=Paraclostridium sordellii TaxID=1505 RepID=UPI0005E88797|nr:hypothetical protein [Paeniclostridium sordellii]CEQ01687.1 Uncharacterised protein [[Clostridium] sordellii] [Paeniclostridium sordellii]
MSKWTDEKIAMLKQVYKTHEYTINELADILGFTRNQVTNKARQIGATWVDESKIPETHKYCKKCDSILHKSLFYKNKTKPDGLASNCIECQKKHKRKSPEKIIELKTCPKCGKEKPITEFSKGQSWCKECNRNYYIENKNKGE